MVIGLQHLFVSIIHKSHVDYKSVGLVLYYTFAQIQSLLVYFSLFLASLPYINWTTTQILANNALSRLNWFSDGMFKQTRVPTRVCAGDMSSLIAL